jgi:hypothetical protein
MDGDACRARLWMTTSVALTCGRAALGICLMIAPRLIGRVWLVDTDIPSVDHLARIVGVREMALAVSPWLIAGTTAALLHPRHSAAVAADSAVGSSGCAQAGAPRQ